MLSIWRLSDNRGVDLSLRDTIPPNDPEEKEVQKLTDQYTKKIDDHLAHKEKEIMTV